jgi:single-strand DNA-binding protein
VKTLNKAMILGRLGQDPVVKHSTDGSQVTSFSLATTNTSNRNGEKKESTEWHNCVAFGRTAEIAGQYLKKGSQALVEGSLRTSKYKDKEGNERQSTNIVVNQLTLLGGKSEPKEQFQKGDKDYGDSDIPFD